MKPSEVQTLLKRIRKTRHLTQEQLAQMLGVSFSAVNQWENGRRRPMPFLLAKLVDLDTGKHPQPQNTKIRVSKNTVIPDSPKPTQKTLETLYEKLEEKERELERANQTITQISRDLQERVKELSCLYKINKISTLINVSWEERLRRIVSQLPGAWNFPEFTCARITISDLKIATPLFFESEHCQVRDITVAGKILGRLEIFVSEKAPFQLGKPFLEEEEDLLDSIAADIQQMLFHKEMQDLAKRHEKEMMRLDRLSALGTLVSGVAHEINNPNNFIMLNTPLLRDIFEEAIPILDEYHDENGDFSLGGLYYSEVRESIYSLFDGIVEGATRIRNIVKNLKNSGRDDSADMCQLVDVNKVICSAHTLINSQISKSTNHFNLKLGKIRNVTGNFHRLEQVVVNLLQNACESLATRENAIFVSTYENRRKGMIVIEIRDQGTGIAADLISKVINPFFTTKRELGGTGLGLSVSHRIIEDHKGKLQLESAAGKGTTATVLLPISSGQ